MESSNMFAKGTEIYMKCLFALQELNPSVEVTTPNNTSTPSSIPYYVPNYTQVSQHVHSQPLMYVPNQYALQSQVPPTYDGSTFKPMNAWPHDYGMFETQKPPSIVTDNRYYNRYDQNVYQYDPQMVNQPPHINMMENPAMEPKWQSQQSMPLTSVQSTTVPNTTDYNDGYLATANQYMPSQTSDTKMMRSSPVPFELPHNNGHQTFEDLNCAKDKKKIRRPMNSFMLYAKRHRKEVHKLYPMCDNRTVSKILSETWYAMESSKKQEYHDLANEMRRNHFKMHPDYRWKTTSDHSPTQQANERAFECNAQNDTAKMHSFDYGQKDLSSPLSPVTPSTENSLSPFAYTDDTKKPTNDPFPVDAQPFRLGPTPAQLKQNKLQANATNDDDKIVDTVPKEQNDCDKTIVTELPQLHQFENRLSLLPQFDFTNYRINSDWDTSPTSPTRYNTFTRKRAQPSNASATEQQCAKKRLIGDRFFGPDFNVNTFKDLDAHSNNSSPATPTSAEDSRIMQDLIFNKRKRILMDQRKMLIMDLFRKCGTFFPAPKDLDDFLEEHMHLFGSKGFLNIKIREYRQKHMQHQSPQ
ncbi:putative transcription factor capicua [Contarinia nasturtii]|uniref:putative transcription factor capicua n=1 Tax=Contarinia nasturtii TaxID=265458 RepID=UPI0012D4BBB2|nr:putative transcription factor capicua [Contarinia nasturtii]